MFSTTICGSDSELAPVTTRNGGFPVRRLAGVLRDSPLRVECGSGGVTGFLETAAWIAPHVAEGYRHLELPEAAAAFEVLWSSITVDRLITDDSYEATDGDIAELEGLAEAVGSHDHERVTLARRHPEVFSI